MATDSQKTDAPSGSSRTELIAVVLSVGWLAFTAVFFVLFPLNDGGFEPMRFIFTLLAVFLPVVMIWVAAVAARTARTMQAETASLHNVIATLQAELAQKKKTNPLSAAGTVERKMTKIAQAGKKPEAAFTTRNTVKSAANPPAQPTAPLDPQPSLGLAVQPEDNAPPLPRVDLIRALNFPDNESDTIGFAALRKALKDRTAKQLVTASQDVLTLLSQDGIYMDDLQPDRARPELWRRFAQGERGRAIGALGGVRDRTSLALTTSRMREDSIFRDAAHHFLRHFDKMLTSFEVVASDAELVELSNTRTARAFMLLGRVTGAFD